MKALEGAHFQLERKHCHCFQVWVQAVVETEEVLGMAHPHRGKYPQPLLQHYVKLQRLIATRLSSWKDELAST